MNETASAKDTSSSGNNPTIVYEAESKSKSEMKTTDESNEKSVKCVWQEMESESQLRESFGNDRVALSVVSALFMTASIAALAVPPSDFYEANSEDLNQITQYVYTTAHTVVIGSCSSAIFTGTWQYLKLNMAPAAAVDEMVLALSSYHPLICEPVIYCSMSMLGMAVGIVSGIYLIYGHVSFWISLTLMTMFTMQILTAIYSAEQTFKEVVESVNYKERNE